MKSAHVIILLCILPLITISGCVRVGSVSGPLRLHSCVGQTYLLIVDCYVVQPNWKDRTLIISPDKAPHYRLPLPVQTAHVGRVFHGDLIVGLIPSGTVFRVEDVKRVRSVEFDYLMPLVRIISEGEKGGAVFNAYRVFSRDTDGPEIITEYGMLEAIP